MSIIRQKLSEMEIVNLTTDTDILEDATGYFDRRLDHDLIRSAVKTRYGLGIKSVTDENNPTVSIETYVREETSINVDSGIYETIGIGFGQKVTGALANLFSEPGQVFSLSHETLEADALKEVDELIKDYRKSGKYSQAMTEADERAIQLGAGAVIITFTGGSIDYNVSTASRMRFYFPDSIIETVNGIEVTRSPIRTDVEDCYAVVMRISTADDTENGYLAIMGRSVDWPQGRHVQYKASSNETAIPEIGDDRIIYEYLVDGKPANPLSVQANFNLNLFVPEYPIGIIRGLIKDDATPMPVSYSLYEDSLEFDVAASHIAGKSQEAAGGANVLSLSEVGEGKPLPRTLDGNIVTLAGQELEHVSKSANDARTANATTREQMVDCGAGYGVPDFYMSSEDHTVDASSGIALEIKSRPLKRVRDRRINANEGEVNRIFEVEKWLIIAHDKDTTPSVIEVLKNCTQVWQPGEINLPQNKTELMVELQQAGDQGIMDTIAKIKKYYQLATDTEAEELYEKLKQRAIDFPPIQITEPVKKTVGLLRNRTDEQTTN